AAVILDGDTLAMRGEGGVEPDVAVGPHTVLIEGEGFRKRADAITIEPGLTLERSYVLDRVHGAPWLTTHGAVAGAVAAGLGAALWGRGVSGGFDYGVGRSLDLDPSIRSAGMGAAASAVFWGGDVDDWANPALLAAQRGARYQLGKALLTPETVANR